MKDIDNDEPTFFVSRRGRKVGVHQVDLTGINIDSTGTSNRLPQPVEKAVNAKKPAKVRSVKKTWDKRRILITASVVVLLALPLLFAEFIAAQYRGGTVQARNELARLVRDKVLPAQKKTSLSAEQIRGFADEVTGVVGSMCRGGLMDNAAGLYPRAKSALTECKSSQTQYAALANSLYVLEAQAKYLEQVNAFIKPVATPITDEFAVIGAQQTTWQTAVSGLEKLSPPDTMSAPHGELVRRTKAVASAWSKLNTANNTQDAVGFSEAEDALATGYESVRQTSAEFTEVLAGTQSIISKNYNALQ